MSLLIEIKPQARGILPHLKEIWLYRELVYFFVWRDVKVRYRQTLLGVGWVLIQPALITFIFTIILSRYAQSFIQNIPYWLFAFSGFVVWTFVATAINNAANCFVNHKEMVTRVYFPRLMMPFAAVIVNLIDLKINLIVLLIAVGFTIGGFSWKILLLPFFVFLIFLITLSLGILFSAFNVRYRDVKHGLPFVLQMMMFATPVFYSVEFLPEKWRFIWKLNPLVGAFEGLRSSVFDSEFDLIGILISVFMAFFLFSLALYVFSIMEENFADII
ncbi:MAG: ABC transporter permease [Pyrinomonadaceae bacterium]|nr:ABC transporter permease [Pyrinomonadaceae bacterium]MCX7640583.1 ABC transporter permease [Pyrinomonadaceae bacterium]MDW8303836.1 ABC transporter permease [Acidobacteriota bacterium]